MCVLASFWLVAFVLKIKCAFEALSVHVACVVYAWALLRMKAPLGGGVCGPSVPVAVRSQVLDPTDHLHPRCCNSSSAL